MFVITIDDISLPEKNLMIAYLQMEEAELAQKILMLNTACEDLVTDMIPNTPISDGTWETLKNEYVLWQMWREYNNPDFAEKSNQAKADFMYFIDTIRDNKYKQQVLSKQNDSIKTKGLLIV